MLEQLLGWRRPRLSRAAASLSGTEHPASPENRPPHLHHRASPPPEHQQQRSSTTRTTATTSRRVRRVSLAELFASTQRDTISGPSFYRSASDRTRAILEQLQSGRVLVMEDQTCYADYGNEDDCLPVLPDSCCPICLVDWHYGERVMACPRPCQHVFHVPCLTQWLDASNSSATKRCPCCRLPLDPTPQPQPREITRLRLPATRDPLDLVMNTNHGVNEDDAIDDILWSALNVDELDVDTVMDNMSEMAVADGGRGTILTYFRLPPDETAQSATHDREENRPSLTSVNAAVTIHDTMNLVDLDDVSDYMEDPQQPSRSQRPPPPPPASDLKERLLPWVDSERGAPPESCLWVGHHHVDSVSRHCALCRGSYEATSRYTVSRDVHCPHLYHEECWLDYASRYLLEHDDNAATEDDNHAAVDSTPSIVPMVRNNGVEVRSVPCVCCHRPYMCVPEDVVVVPNRSQHNPSPRRQRRLWSF